MSPEKPIFSVRVRELVEFVWRRGDLGGERDFVGPERALAGTRGHQRIQRSRPAGYRKEVSVSHQIETEEFTLRVQGRIDGLMGSADEVVLEEIKTVQGSWDGVADPLHWAQTKVYGFLHAQQSAWETVTLQLTYLHLETGELSEFREDWSRAALSEFFEDTTTRYLVWIQERWRWCQLRDQSIRALAFPFSQYRPGQREMAVAAYRIMARGGRLFIEAPTGIGKTMAVIFPALKALAEGRLERIFYLTARTVGRTVAEKAWADLRQGGLRVRTLTLTAKERICVREGQACDPSTCPLARGYYNRWHAAMRAALARESLTRPVLEEVSREHQVCPFELSLDVSLWVDAVVCDANYVFDPQVYLRRHFAEDAGDYALLVDEAHNLVDRAREMFSAEIETREIRDVQRAIRSAVPRCARALARLSSALRKLVRSDASAADENEETEPGELDFFPKKVPPEPSHTGTGPVAREVRSAGETRDVLTLRDLPESLPPLLDDALKAAESWLARNQPAEFRDALLQLYFRLFQFRRTAEVYDECYVSLLEPTPTVRLRLFCLDPSLRLRQALDRGKATIFFSATLTPMDYYRTLLGGAETDSLIQLSSPFPPENLAVLVQDRIRTQFKARAETLAQVAEAIGALVQGRSGNYLVYLPSYQYLNAVQEQFQTQFPQSTNLGPAPRSDGTGTGGVLVGIRCGTWRDARRVRRHGRDFWRRN